MSEIVVAMPVPLWVYATTGVMLAISYLIWPQEDGRALKNGILLAGLAMMAVLYFVPWYSRKPFLRDLRRVKVGMEEKDVRRIMKHYIEGTGWPVIQGAVANGGGELQDVGSGNVYNTSSRDGEMTIQNALVFRHSDSAEFNSDWGMAKFDEGKVISVEFSPD